jgi:YVTN family beta-propeller protein
LSRAVLLIAILSSVLAAPPGPDLPPPLASRGAVFVYLQPFGPDAARLSFRIEALAAVPEAGPPIPIAVSLPGVEGREIDRQRRLGHGPLAPGRYSGLTLSVSRAALQGEDGRADLVSAPGPVEIPVPFVVEKGRAVVLSLGLDYRASVVEAYRFSPAFATRPAVPPPVARLGLASSPGAAHVCIYDRVSGEVVGFLLTGPGPAGMALDSGRNRAYVALSEQDAVIAVDLLEQRVVQTLRLQGGDEPTEVALTPDGRTLLSANSGSRTVSVIHALSLVQVDRIVVGDRPESVIVEPRGQRAWTFNAADSSLSVLDLSRRAVVGAVATESEPFRGQFSRSGDVLFVIHRRSPFLLVVDPASLSASRRILLGTPGTALKVDPRTDLLYVAPEGAGAIDVYDPLSLLPVEPIPTSGTVTFLAIDGDEGRLHAALSGRGEVWSFPLVGKKIASRIDVGADSYWIDLVGER